MSFFSGKFWAYSSLIGLLIPMVGWADCFITGDEIRCLKPRLNMYDQGKLLFGDDDPTVVAQDAPQGSIYAQTGASGGYLYMKQDAGLTTTWTRLGSGGGAGTGDVVGPASSVNNRVALFNGTTGKLIKQSAIDDTHLNYLTDVTSNLQAQIDGKEPTIASPLAPTTKYWRGDKTWTVLDTSAVPENTNLYWTPARFDTRFALKTTSDLTEGTNLYYTDARAKTATVSDTAYNATTWDAVTDVAPSKNAVRDQIETMLTSIGGKEPAITAGTSSQYWRGDKTWQTLNTDAVPESGAPTNLWFTNGRVILAPLTGFASTTGTVTATDTVIQGIQKNTGNLSAHIAATSAHGVSGAIVGTTDTQTLTNKSLIDASTSILDDLDNTKVAKFQASGISTGTTRTYNLADVSGTLFVNGVFQTLASNFVAESNQWFNNADPSKRLVFDLSGQSTATTTTIKTGGTAARTFQFPDKDGIAVVQSNTDATKKVFFTTANMATGQTVNLNPTSSSAGASYTYNLPNTSGHAATTSMVLASDDRQYFKDWMGLLNSTPSHTSGAFFDWEDEGVGGYTEPSNSILGEIYMYAFNNDIWIQLNGGSKIGMFQTRPILNGGTGATTANGALNNLLPSQTANSGKFLKTDGTNTSWATPPNQITAVSVAFTDGDVSRRVTVTDAAATTSSKIVLSVVRPDQADEVNDTGHFYAAQVVKRASGTFDVEIVATGLGFDDATEYAPNETVTLEYLIQ